MHMGERGNAILDAMKAGMLPKIKDHTNRKYLQAITDRMKPLLSSLQTPLFPAVASAFQSS